MTFNIPQYVGIPLLICTITGVVVIGILVSSIFSVSVDRFIQWRKQVKYKQASIDSASNLSSAERELIIAEALATDAGRAALAQAMVEPIRTGLEYQSVGRRILNVDALPNSALSFYERDINSTAQVISRGRLPDRTLEGEEVSIGLFTADDAMSDLQLELDRLDKLYPKQEKEYKSRPKQLIVDDFMED